MTMDERALKTGLCCWRAFKLSKTDRSKLGRERHSPFICNKPIDPPDELLCEKHSKQFNEI